MTPTGNPAAAEPDLWASQLRKGVLELAVLALLADEPTYGSQIVERLADRPSIAMTAGTVYPLLARLRKAELVETHWQESPHGPPRKYYELTASGMRTLGEMTASWHLVSSTVDALLAPNERTRR